jgi:CheY-like chemotaxis protein
LALSQPLVGDKKLTLHNAISDNLPAVEADEDRLQQIFHNLIGNAIKFTDEGKVTVRALISGDSVEISVSYTRTGMDSEQFTTIFESFEQVEGNVERGYSGTGLGLAVSQQLVELHGGKICVASKVAEGSTFSFTLSSTAVKAPYMMTVHQDVARLHVIDGDERYEHQGPLDLVLLDIMMPRVSGYEVCQKLRLTHPVSDLPVIFLTAKNQVADLVQSFAVGANDYLSKPVAKHELLTRVEPT